MSPEDQSRADAPLPYAGIRVVEFTHMVMGPTCGMVLGDLGAEVIKVEPPGGDNTRRLLALRAKVAQWLQGEATHGTIWKTGLPRTMKKEVVHA